MLPLEKQLCFKKWGCESWLIQVSDDSGSKKVSIANDIAELALLAWGSSHWGMSVWLKCFSNDDQGLRQLRVQTWEEADPANAAVKLYLLYLEFFLPDFSKIISLNILVFTYQLPSLLLSLWVQSNFSILLDSWIIMLCVISKTYYLKSFQSWFI